MASSAYTQVRNGAVGLSTVLFGYVTWKTQNQAQNVAEEHRGALYTRMAEVGRAVFTSTTIEDSRTAIRHAETVSTLAVKGAPCGQKAPKVVYDYDPLEGLCVSRKAQNTKELVYSGESNEAIGYANEPLCPCTRVDLVAGNYIRCPDMISNNGASEDVLLVRPQENQPCEALRSFIAKTAAQGW